ncbi:lipocalin-like domain protein, partial [Vibrio cholerae HC-37A1]
MSGRKP